MIWEYTVSTNTIWTSFDFGEVEADTLGEAIQKAKDEVKSKLDKVNIAISQCDITYGMTIDINLDNIEVSPKKTPRYDHAMDIGFTVVSNSEDDPSNEEIIAGLERRLKLLKDNPDEIKEATSIYDSVDTKDS